MRAPYDLAIIGGGVNGTAIARDAAGRGFKVILLEKGDLAAATSSASTKLIHGGLRYLEYGEVWLVRKALAEREVLLKSAPHIIWPLRFVLPQTAQSRPDWMVKLGLGLYDHLARRDVLPASEALDFTQHEFGYPLNGSVKTGFAYSDCWVEDARLVVLQAMDAARNGAHVFTRSAVTHLTPSDAGWALHTENGHSVNARMVVNAAGPWVHSLFTDTGLPTQSLPQVRLVRGSHIVVPALYTGDQAYLLQQPDGRVVFAIPYEGPFTLIGTTDIPHPDAHTPPTCTPEEQAYLCAAANRFFNSQIQPENCVWTYSGVRPLFDDGASKASAVTRDYHLDIRAVEGSPILSVYGGKITTCRVLAEQVMTRIEKILGTRGPAWTRGATLPGGDVPDGNFPDFVDDMVALFPWLPGDILLRYARAYGTRMLRLIGTAKSLAGLGTHHGDGIYEAEIDYVMRHEWAHSVDDFLWRRSKMGLHVNASTTKILKHRMGG